MRHQNSKGKQRFYSACVLLALINLHANATVSVLQSLDFGTIAVTNNNFAASLEITPNGNMQVVGGIAVLQNGNPGVFEISGYPPNTTLDVDVNVLNTQMISEIASEETFSLSLIVNSETVFTDNAGVALLSVGGRISSSGTGSNAFTDTRYNSTIQITVNL